MRHSFRLSVACVLLQALILVVPVIALGATEVSPPERPEVEDRPVVGLVLSGGGAKGLAHVGVLRVLEEIQVPVDMVVGTSAGAAVGALYAQGLSVGEIEDRLLDLDWVSSFQDTPGRTYEPVHRKSEGWRFPVRPGLGLASTAFASGAA